MDCKLIVFMLTGALFSAAFAQIHQYNFVNTPLNWTSAQSVCRRDYTDLATIESSADVTAVIRTTSNSTGKAWIGLHDDLINSWKWSLNDSSFYGAGGSTFRYWFTNQPNNNGGQQYCVTLFSGSPQFGTWDDIECNNERHFVCYNGTINGAASFVYIATFLNWSDAQRFCRENYVDLASIRDLTENTIIRNLAGGNVVWIGLYRQKVWSDGSNSLFQHWADGQPDSGLEQCVAAALNDSGRWSDENCALSLPFVCYTNKQSCTETGCPTGMECITSNGIAQCVDPCENYTVLIDAWRSINNTNNSVLHCDRYVSWNGWYRFFLGQNSAQIPERCIEENRCGTHAPLWITEPHPTQTNVIVTRTVCNAWSGSCCYFSSHTIQVKLCYGNFYVYKLVQPSTCYLAYCAESVGPNFRASGQNETSITLQWDKVNNSISFVLLFNGSETNITAPDENKTVTYTVSSLTPGTKYTFTLFYLIENIRSSRVLLTAVTAPQKVESFRASGQNETSVTLQWNKINNNISFILLFNGRETSISAPVGNGPVTYTVSSLTAGTIYTFTLFSVFENVRSSAVSITAVTAPPNANEFKSSERNETSITLQWNRVNRNISFILLFNGTETNITAPDGDGSVTYTVSSLTAGTKYNFTLFSVFENIRSSGVTITAFTGPNYVIGINARIVSLRNLTKSEIETLLIEFLRRNNLQSQFSLKVRAVKP